MCLIDPWFAVPLTDNIIPTANTPTNLLLHVIGFWWLIPAFSNMKGVSPIFIAVQQELTKQRQAQKTVYQNVHEIYLSLLTIKLSQAQISPTKGCGWWSFKHTRLAFITSQKLSEVHSFAYTKTNKLDPNKENKSLQFDFSFPSSTKWLSVIGDMLAGFEKRDELIRTLEMVYLERKLSTQASYVPRRVLLFTPSMREGEQPWIVGYTNRKFSVGGYRSVPE